MEFSIVKNSSKLSVGVGSALVDILLEESDEFVAATGAAKGGMTLVEAADIEKTVALSDNSTSIVPGGSACNTIIGLGKLSGNATFIGKRGDDELGETLEAALENHSVKPILEKSKTETGRVLSIITPDAQRSMFTFLGAAAESSAEEMSVEKFKDAALVHLEGYLLFNKDLIFAALKAAKESGAVISLDLASFQVVEASKDILYEIVRDYVDILLANEDEAKAYTGIENEKESLAKLAEDVEIAVLKVGKRGSYISYKGEVTEMGIMGSGEAKDTTGAGDLWASGFLYGVINGLSVEKSGKIGAACGYEVCQVIGAHIPEDGWDRIKKVVAE